MSTTATRRDGGVGASDLRSALEAAVASDDHAIQRMGHADTRVTFRVEGEEATITLRLDDESVEVDDGEDGEVEISLNADQVAAFVSGELSMPAAVIAHQVETSGPVRKYLQVDAILRRLLAVEAGVDQGERSERGTGEGLPAADDIDADVLALETRDLHKAFGSAEILKGLNLKIPEGVISVVLGPSGTGKSVLLQHVIGLMQPDKGEVLIRGNKLSGMSRAEILAQQRGIGVMFQDGALFSDMNVYDNVAFPLRQHTDLREDEIEYVVMEHLQSVGLASAARAAPGSLSGGMRKRAGLARALVLDPGIVLCDEPDSGLDPVRTALLGELLVEQHAQHGGTMLIVTHNIMLAKLVADHITVVWQGEVLESGFASHMLESESEFVRQFLAGAPEGPLGMDNA